MSTDTFESAVPEPLARWRIVDIGNVRQMCAAAELAPGLSQVTTLRYQDEMSYAEIARALDTSTKTVASRIHRAKLFLRTKFTGETEENDSPT